MGSKTRLTMTTNQRYALFKWLEESVASGVLHGNTDKAVAAMAIDALGFPISENSISDIRKDAGIPNLTWRTSKEKDPAPVAFDGDDMRVAAKTLLSVIYALESCQIPVNAPPELDDWLSRMGISRSSQSIQQFLDLKAGGSE